MPDRIKSLEGVDNFRDFGGYAVGDGKSVKRNRLFRTAHLSEATQSDISFIDALGIDFQVDLRRTSERMNQPHAWSPDVVHVHEGDPNAPAPHLAYLNSNNVSAAGAREFMIDFYSTAPFDPRLIKLYKLWFQGLDSHDGAGLINCTAGKDRTGLGCAITLSLLGVDHDDVVKDYEKTNEAVDMDRAIARTLQAFSEVAADVPVEALHFMFSVHADYLETSLSAIQDKHGGLHNYAREVLDVDEHRLERLYSRLVE